MSKRNRHRNRDQHKAPSADPKLAAKGDATAAPSVAGDDDEELEISVGASAGAPEAAAALASSGPIAEPAPEAVAAAGPAAAAVEAKSEAVAETKNEAVAEAKSEAAVEAKSEVAVEKLAEVIPFTAPPAEAAPRARVVTLPESFAPLVERLRSGRCVLWAGSGVDEAAGGAGFRGAIGRLLDELPSDEAAAARALLERRPLVAAGFVRRRLGARFEAALAAAAAAPDVLPDGLTTLAALPFRAVIATGWSDAFDRALSGDGEPPTVFTPATLASASRHGRVRPLVKLLGDPAQPGSAICSARDVEALLVDGKRIAALRDLTRNRAVLHLGLDPAIDLDLFLDRLAVDEGAHEVEHFAVVAGLSSVERDELAAAHGVTVVDEADLFGFVRALREAVGDVARGAPEDDDLHGWLAVLTDEPDRVEARDKLAAIERKLREAGDPEKLLELHVGLVEVEQSHEGRAARLREVADLFEHRFGDKGRAFTALLAAYKEDPAHDVAERIEALAEATAGWAELLSEYVQVAPSLPETARAAHWMRVARLYGEKLGHAEYALHAVDEALRIDPDDRAAKEARVGFLRRAEKWKELTEALGALAAGEESLGRRAELYLEQGELFETRLLDGPAAAKAFRAALEADPGSEDAIRALEHLHRRRGDHRELVAVLDERAKGAGDERALELRREAAALVAEKLGDRKAAIERYEALRTDGVVDLEILRALERLYEAEGRTDDYLAAIAEQAAAVPDEKEKQLLYRRLAAEWEERPDGAARAAEYLEKLLALDPKAEDALRAVERLYAADKKWEALVDAYRRHLELPGADRIALQTAIAQTFGGEIGDTHRAIDAWNQVLALSTAADPSGQGGQAGEALAQLAKLYEKTEAWPLALATIDKRVEQLKDRDEKVRLLFESGRLAAERLGDVKQAEERYHRALEADPAHVPSMQAIVELYRKSGEFLRAAKLLVEAEAHTQNRLEKTRMLVEAGEIYDSLEQHDTATELYLRAMQVDPEHVEAGNRVSELLWKAERYGELVPILEMLTRKEADKATQKTRWVRLGRAARAIGLGEKSARAYSRAAELDPSDVEAQRARAELLFGEEKWSDALEAYKSVLLHGGDSLTDAERVDLYYHLGECDRRLGVIDKAKNFYAKALEIDPTHRPTILARIEVESDDPKKILEAKRALLPTATGDEERVKLLSEIGDLWLDKIEDPPAALAAWGEALAIKPDARSILHKCLDVHVEQKDWAHALDVLEKLTGFEQVPSVRAKLKFTRAAIHLEELNNKEEGIKLLAEAIDDDPAATRAPERLEELLVAEQSWKELTRFYRKAIKRVGPEVESDSPETKKERLRLWNALADTLLEKMGDVASAIPALEVAATFDRTNARRQEQLSELYVAAGPDYLDKAIAAHQGLLRSQHDRIASYRVLRALYEQAKQPDKAMALAYALAFLKKGDPADAEKVAELKKRPLSPVRRNLDDEMWNRNLTHPDEDRFVSALFLQLLPTLAKAHSVPHKDVPLSRKDKVESTDPRSFAKGLRYVAAALNVTLPYECYVRYEQRDPLAIANCLDAKLVPVACLVVGAPMLGDKRGERELIFELTKRLSYFRPERYLRFVLPQAAQLGMVIDAAMSVAAESERERPATGEIGRIAQDLKRALPPKSLEQVVLIAKKLRAGNPGRNGEALAQSWLAATELTATRAAFLLLGDLETTARFVAAEPQTTSPHPTLHRLKELIYFSVTEECFALRKHLGLLS